jgi:coproporphyrinogen III oxidase-like Fe-S oxidoreductase
VGTSDDSPALLAPGEHKVTHSDRSSWPFATLLPYSVMYNYPPPQLMKLAPARPAAEWPPPMRRGVREWKEKTDGLARHVNQLYIHVPFCPFICDFCPFYKIKGPRPEVTEEFTVTLIQEIEHYARQGALADREFSVIYFGGGTPTELSPGQLARILRSLRDHFNVRPDVEITLESVARHLTAPGYLEACLREGFNRVSFGIQSLEEKVRRAIGRTGDHVEDYAQAIEVARMLDPQLPLNVELLHGCPEQSTESFESDLRRLIDWGVGSIDVFSYVMMPGTPLYRKVLQGTSPLPRYGQDMLDQRRLAQRMLEGEGYHQAAAEMFKKNDRGWFTRSFYGASGNSMHTVLALGPSAVGHIDGTLYRNTPDLAQYHREVRQGLLPISAVQRMSRGELRRRALLLSIAQLFVPFPLVESRGERRSFRRWESQGLVGRTDSGWRLEAEGTIWYNQMQFQLLPVMDSLSNLRALGSMEDQYALLRGGNPLGQELLYLARAYGHFGPLALLGYRQFLRVARHLPSRWSDAVSWVGRPVRRTVRSS